MQTRFFHVLQALSRLGEEMTLMNAVEDVESTREMFGSIKDYTLHGKWLCAWLPADDAKEIAKNTISFLLECEYDDNYRLLCARYDGHSSITKRIVNE